MLYLVTGGSGSGKSAYAEQTAVNLYADRKSGGRLYYVATMYPYEDGETEQRIERHRSMRRGKGFETIECYTELAALEKAAVCRDVLLLECMSNLLANEMFLETGGLRAQGENNVDMTSLHEKTEERILAPIMRMAQSGGCVVVVTNEIFSDGRAGEYDSDTRRYIELLGYINRRLAEMADCCVEVVCGIPLMFGRRPSEQKEKTVSVAGRRKA